MTTFGRFHRTCAVGGLVALVLAAGSARAQRPAPTTYPFAAPPLGVYDRLVGAGLAPADLLPAADRKLLADFRAARAAGAGTDVPQADAAAVVLHLLASGVTDPAERAGYLKRFDAVADGARRATAGAGTPAAKADALLRFLHQGVMAGGYAADETTLPRLFDTGRYNCVSSACLYFLVGSRLGLTLRPVLYEGSGASPGHAAVDLDDGGTRTDIEPTSPDGFDAAAKGRRPGVIVLGRIPDRKEGYDADGFGLAAAIAGNLGAKATGADAVRLLVVALALAPADPTAANNTRAAVVNWGLSHSQADRFEEAVKVYAFGRAALGGDDKMEHNYRVIWSQYLDSVFGAGRVEAGLKLLPRAAAAFPKDKAFGDAGEWVRRAAQKRADKDGWAAGLAAADAALKVIPADAAKGVRGWQSAARRMWSQDHLRKGNPDGSLAVLVAGLAAAPDDRELLAGLAFHAQEALALLDAKQGTAAAAAHFEALRKEFPKNKDIAERGFNHAAQAVDRVCGRKTFADALNAADGYAPLAGGRVAELKSQVFDRWATSLAGDGKWEAAVAKYVEGLKATPDDRLLGTNVIATIDAWARGSMDRRDWAAAVAVYEIGLRHFPDNGHLKNNRDYCREQQGR